MLIGNVKHVAQKFFQYEERLSEFIEDAWSVIRDKIASNDTENSISDLLYVELKANSGIRTIGTVLREHMLIDIDQKGDPVTKGFIDIVVLVDEYHNPDVYIAYECKRLNVTYEGKKHSLIDKYTNQGVARFVSAQYARKLPVGCMLGYVMDGDEDSVQGSLFAYLESKKETLNMSSIEMIKKPSYFYTIHYQSNKKETIRVMHTLLPVV